MISEPRADSLVNLDSSEEIKALPSRRILEGLPERRIPLGETPPDAVPHEALLQFADEAAWDQFLAAAFGSDVVLGENEVLRVVRVDLRRLWDNADLRQLAEDAEWEHHYHVYAPDLPFLPEGGNEVPFGAHAARAVGFPDARDQWGRGVRIAVMDTRVAQQHPALAHLSIAQFDFLGEGSWESSSGYQGHGTAVLSILAGQGSSLPALAPGADLSVYRVLDDSGIGTSFAIANAIVAAADAGNQIISLSLGTYQNSSILHEAVRYAQSRGVTLVAAAGNDGVQGRVLYPAAYDGVVSVGAVDAQWQRAGFSNQGSSLDLAAPGVGIPAAWWEDDAAPDLEGVVWFTGTSASTPFVVGAMAGLLSQDPTLLPGDALDFLKKYANDAGKPGKDDEFGHGIMNVQRVLERNTSGIHDVALAGVWAEPVSSGSLATVELTLNTENRGTENIPAVTLHVRDAHGIHRTYTMGGLAPNQSRAHTIQIPVNFGMNNQPVEMEAWVEMHGARDRDPDNNSGRIVIQQHPGD